MPRRDPHDVLDVEPGASAATIKAAWRRLARSNHPDLTGDDPAASQAATRRMAEINTAYETLRRQGERDGRPGMARDGGNAGGAGDTGFDGPTGPRRGGPPRPRPGRPVTGRVDTSETFRPRNATSGPSHTGTGTWSGARRPGTTAAGAAAIGGQPPRREADREPPRASQPTGPAERGRLHRFRAPTPPSLDAARSLELEFGKFRGHTLGEVAAFEPSYVDWLASTITRDRDLVAAARVIRSDLDTRGVARRARPARAAAGQSA